jgi:molybdopterin-synthase adenylyltransferase
MSNSSHNLIDTRYSRQSLFAPIGREGQARLMRSRVTLIGCGALGTVLADILVRAGTGFVRIVDRDFVEESNLQRQVLFDTQDVADNLPKVEAARRKLEAINPHVEVESVVKDVDSLSILSLIEDADLVMDGTDNFETRYLINDAAVSLNKPWVYGAAVGSTGMTTTIVPGKTPCLSCLYETMPPPGSSPTCDNAGVLASIIHMVTGVQSAEAFKILSGNMDAVGGKLHYFDVWHGEFRTLDVSKARNPNCETCGQRRFVHLTAERGSYTTNLCGRNAVQISWKERHDVDLGKVAERLSASGDVTQNRFLLKFRNAEIGMTLFPDGRAIMEGVTDPDRARELYAKFVG